MELRPEMQHPEMLPIPPEVQHLDECFQVFGMDAVWDQAEATVADIFQRAGRTYLDPAQRRAVDILHEELQYKLFAPPGANLPESLIVVRSNTNRASIWHNPAVSAESTSDYDRDRFFNDVVGRDLERVRYDILQALRLRQPEIETSLQEWVRELPEYEFLKSFETPAPMTRDMPLSPYWYQVRSQQITDDVRKRFGLTAEESIRLHPEALVALQVAQLRLDDEQMRSKDPEAISGLEKLKHFFRQDVEIQLEDLRQDELEELEIDPGATLYPKGPWKVYEIRSEGGYAIELNGERRYDPSELFNFEYTAGTIRDHYGFRISYGYLYDIAFNMLFDEDREWSSFEEYLDVVVEQFAREMFESKVRRTDLTFLSSRDIVQSEKFPYLPSSPAFHVGAIAKWRSSLALDLIRRSYETEGLGLASRPDLATINSRWQMERRAQTTIAAVIQEPLNLPQVSRVISLRPIPMGLPDIDYERSGQLVIELDNSSRSSRDPIPFIPGFEAVGMNVPSRQSPRQVVAYQAVEHDPYQSVSVSLPDTTELVSLYRQLGLESLARLIEERPDMTVQDLADSIHISSKYYLPDDDVDAEVHRVGDTLGSFLPWVKDGVLQTQCDGANLFLVRSLEILFGGRSAALHTGYILTPGESRITAVGHAQTIFEHEGKIYILDATPAGQPQYGEAQGIQRLDTSRSELLVAKESGMTLKTHDSPSKKADPIAPKIDRLNIPTPLNADKLEAEHVQAAMGQLVLRLEGQLKAILQTPSETKLYERIIRLPRHDPLRASLSLFKRSLGERSVTLEEIDQHSRLLDGIQEAPLAVKHRLKVDQYDAVVLSSLVRLKNELRQLLERQKEAATSTV